MESRRRFKSTTWLTSSLFENCWDCWNRAERSVSVYHHRSIRLLHVLTDEAFGSTGRWETSSNSLLVLIRPQLLLLLPLRLSQIHFSRRRQSSPRPIGIHSLFSSQISQHPVCAGTQQASEECSSGRCSSWIRRQLALRSSAVTSTVHWDFYRR